MKRIITVTVFILFFFEDEVMEGLGDYGLK